jgi:hypothetical protein
MPDVSTEIVIPADYQLKGSLPFRVPILPFTFNLPTKRLMPAGRLRVMVRQFVSNGVGILAAPLGEVRETRIYQWLSLPRPDVWWADGNEHWSMSVSPGLHWSQMVVLANQGDPAPLLTSMFIQP